METLQIYKSFNSDKSIEELQYKILIDTTTIENIKFEFQFYKSLLSKPIFKPHVLNLYETLTKFKDEIKTINENAIGLLNELHSHANLIRNKIECDDMACDNFFNKEHDAIDLKVFNFRTQVFNFKFRLFQYIESVINS